jgi:trehalose 6-phosphate phosphatase
MTAAAPTGGPSYVDPESLISAARLRGRPLLLMLDVDGTLAPIVLRPSLAQVPEETRRVLASLVTRPGVFVVLVSGRAASDARRVVGVENVWTIGNHGAEVMRPTGEITVDAGVARYAEPVAQTARTLEPLLESFDGVALENKRWTLSVHYRAADDAIVPRLRDEVDRVAARHNLRVTQGKKVFEIRPPVPVDKGTGIQRVVGELHASSDDASLLFAGDDATDEDAFQMLRAQFPRAVTIQIGDQSNTAAEFRFAAPDQLRALLERIARDTFA